VRWLAFGTYDVQAHPRVAVLLEGLAARGEVVDEVVRPLGLSTAARVDLLQRPWRLPLAAVRVLGCWGRLVAAAGPRLLGPGAGYDVVLVGYLGHFDVLLARALLAAARVRHPARRRPVVVLDHLVSAAGTAADRGLAGGGGPKDRLLRAVDAAAVRAADVVLVDTEQRLAELGPADRERAVVVPVGATREWFAAGAAHLSAAAAAEPHALRAIFVGLFTPLQGTTTIAEALALLPPPPADGHGGIRVTLAGAGQDLAAARQRAGGVVGVTWVDWLPATDLPAVVRTFDVGLGIFGTTPKALAVVPTKVFQAAAAACAVVTSDTAPQRLSLGDAAVFVPAGDARALAQALTELAADPGEVRRLGAVAHERAQAHFTGHAVVAPLLDRLRALRPDRAGGEPQ
jgi:glycosyltransferase involved in cell wall biosynthesis